MKFRRAQVAFTAGELDPKLKGRRDTQIFYLGCERLRNSLVRQQGSTFVRPGLRNIIGIRGNPVDPDAPFVRLLPFVFNSEQRYVLALTYFNVAIFRSSDNAVVSVLTIPYPKEALPEVDWIQIGDTMLLAHERFPLYQIQRQFDGTFTAGPYVFEFPPQFRIQPRTFTLTPSGTTGTVTMTAQPGIPLFRPGYLTIGNAAHKSDIGGRWTFRGVQFTILSVADDGATASVSIQGAFPDTTASEVWTEPAAQQTWGYHRALAYFQDRLWIGGAFSLPVGLWASRTGAPFDFYASSANDDEPFQFNIGDGRIAPILYLQPGAGGLEVYTTDNEGLIPGNTLEPITPGTVRYVSQSQFGSRQVKPVRLNANTIFVDRSGIVRELIFSEEEQNYKSTPLAIRASHLVRNVVRMTAAPGGLGQQIDFLLFTNANGVGAAVTLEPTQEVAAWSELVSARAILDMIAVGSTTYAAVKDGNRVWLQTFEPGCIFDGQVTVDRFPATTTVTGLTHLAGSIAEAFCDGYWVGPVTVDAAGTATLPFPAQHVDIGFKIDWLVRPMPLESENNSMLGRAHRPFRAEVRFDASAGLRVNGELILDRPFDDVDLTPPQQTSDVRRVHLQAGWSRGASAPIDITREGPFAAEILAFAIDYRVGGV